MLTDGESTPIESVIDGDTVRLPDGRQIRLVGIQAPKLSLGRAHMTDWPMSQDAKSFLQNLIGAQILQLKYDGTHQDRHGRILAHLFLPGGKWVQAEMISSGMARVYSFPDNKSMTAELLKLESAARTQKRGIWNHPYYAIQNPQSVLDKKFIDTYQLVEGRVREVAEVKKTIYLNFGDNWRDDFTAVIPISARAAFTADKIKPKELTGAVVRVRGWVESKNGPSIELSHAQQLELLSYAPGAKPPDAPKRKKRAKKAEKQDAKPEDMAPVESDEDDLVAE